VPWAVSTGHDRQDLGARAGCGPLSCTTGQELIGKENGARRAAPPRVEAEKIVVELVGAREMGRGLMVLSALKGASSC